MTRRVVVVTASLPRPRPGRRRGAGPAPTWRRALADDVVDLLATLRRGRTPALAVQPADRAFARRGGLAGMRGVRAAARSTVPSVLDAAAADGYEQAALLAARRARPARHADRQAAAAADHPPGAAAAPAAGDEAGLLGLAAACRRRPGCRAVDLDDRDARRRCARRAPQADRRHRPPGWHRLRSAGRPARLDPASTAGTRPAPCSAAASRADR